MVQVIGSRVHSTGFKQGLVTSLIRMRKIWHRDIDPNEMLCCCAPCDQERKPKKVHGSTPIVDIPNGVKIEEKSTSVLEQKKSLHCSTCCTSVKINTCEDLEKYLAICSTEAPIAEGYVCKDTRRSKSFEKFRRRYFVLHNGVLLYYNHRSEYIRDQKNGLVCYTFYS